MSLTLLVEDGTGLIGSNTYVSQADAITYATNWGLTPFLTATSTQQIQALFTATYSLERLYGRRYISVVPPVSEQGLYWPRYTIMGNDFIIYEQGFIPQQLKDAQCEMANMFVSGVSLFPNQSDNKLFKSTSVKVGGISQTNNYWKIPDDVEQYDGFRKVDLILWPILEIDNNDGARMGL
jgi:hypothetical protein